jgi:predicted ATPase
VREVSDPAHAKPTPSALTCRAPDGVGRRAGRTDPSEARRGLQRVPIPPQCRPCHNRHPPHPLSGVVVGREAELAELHGWWRQACQGTRRVGFVTGEAGIGKTTLVDTFVAGVTRETAVWVGRGQCIESYGAGEAYLPLLEALGRLCREPGGASLLARLRQHAPSWLAQMPTLLPPAECEALQRLGRGVTQGRMLRELAEAVEMFTAERPLILVLEDLHWSDVSTCDWLAYVARRRDPARLLVLERVMHSRMPVIRWGYGQKTLPQRCQ